MSSTVSPRVEGSTPVRGKFFADFFSLIQFWHRCQNDLFTEKLEYHSCMMALALIFAKIFQPAQLTFQPFSYATFNLIHNYLV